MAIAIVVEECAASAPSPLLLIQAGLLGDVSERAVAVVVKENVAAPEGAEQVVPSIIVIVADANACLPSTASQARFLCDIGECAVAVVLVEMGCRLFAGGPVFIDPIPIGEVDVEPTVVVVIKKSDATALRLDDDAFVFHASPHVGDGETGSLGHIDELHRRRGLRRCGEHETLISGAPKGCCEDIEQRTAENEGGRREKTAAWKDHRIIWIIGSMLRE